MAQQKRKPQGKSSSTAKAEEKQSEERQQEQPVTEEKQAEETQGTPEDEAQPTSAADAEGGEVTYDTGYEVAEPEGIILDQNDPLELHGDEKDGFLVISDDMYRRVVPKRSKRPTFVLLYRKGTMIPLHTVQRIEKESKEANEQSE